MAENRFAKYATQGAGGENIPMVEVTPQANRFAKYAPAQEPAPEPQSGLDSFLDEGVHQAGLTARNVVKGIATPVTLLADGVAGLQNLATEGINKVAGTHIPYATPSSQLLDKGLDAIDLPQPRNSTERVVGDVVQAVTGTGAMGKAAGMTAEAVQSPMAKKVLQTLTENIGTQAASAATGAAAGGTTRELGGGRVAQFMASLLGGILPVGAAQVATRAGQDLIGVGKAAVEPMTQAGQKQIAGRLMEQNIAGDKNAVIQNLDNIPQYIPNSPVTTAEAAADTGLTSMQRGLRNSKNGNPFADIESQQNAARNEALNGMAGDKASIEAAKKFRNEQTGNLRQTAFDGYNNDPRLPSSNYKDFASNVRGTVKNLSGVDFGNPKNHGQLSDMLAQFGYTVSKKSSASGKSNIFTASKVDPTTGNQISFDVRVGKNPLPNNVASNAIDLTKTDGIKMLGDKIARSEPMKKAVNPNYAVGIADRRLSSPDGNLSDVELTMNAAKERIQNALNMDNPEYAYAIRKDLANDVAGKLAAKAGGAGMDTKKYQRLAAGQLTDILDSLDHQIEQAAPGYQNYMNKFKELSKPINQMEMLQDIRGDVQLRAAPDVQTGHPFLSQPTLTGILRDETGDLAKTLTPEQLAGLKNVESDMTRSASLNQRNVTPVGSNTSANEDAKAMVSNFLAQRATEKIPFGLGKIIQNMGKEKVNALLVEAFKDPELARSLLVELRPELKTTPYSGAMAQKLLAQTIGSMYGANKQ